MPGWLSDYLLTVVSAVGASTLFTGALLWFGRAWISERLKAAIQHEYDVKLESHKAVLKAGQDAALERLRADNAQFSSMLNSASSAFSSAQMAAHQEKLGAIRLLWEKVIYLRGHRHPIANVSDVWGEAVFQRYLRDTPEGKKLIAALEPDPKELGYEEKQAVERLRPFLGEPIYQLFHLYWFLPARIVGEVMGDKALGKTDYKFWTSLPDVRNLLRDVLTPDEFAELDKAQMKLTYVRDKIELKMLALTAEMISGKSASADALKNSGHMAQLIEESRMKMAATAP